MSFRKVDGEGVPEGMVIAEILAWHCKRCGHTWLPRMFGKPRVCPSCKSSYWNVDRKVKS